MTTTELTPPQQLHTLCLTYLKLSAGRLDWSDAQVDAFLKDFAARCEAEGTTVKAALENAACALESCGRTDLLPKPASGRC